MNDELHSEWRQCRKKPVTVMFRGPVQKEEIIHTLEGDHLARIGDYIIKGVKGEQYPIKPEIFRETYETLEANEV